MSSNINIRNNSGEKNSKPPTIERSVSDNPVRIQRKSPKAPWIILAVVLVAFLAVVGYLFRDKFIGDNQPQADEVSDYKAVFLTNGQVYFGMMSDPKSQYVTLTDIFYLQVNQQENLQSGTAVQQQQEEQQPQLSLVKLGNELHGPVDSMQINRDQILFYEDLKEKGKVVEAIKQYKQNPNQVNQNPAQTTVPGVQQGQGTATSGSASGSR